jgi:hypothetical protein
MMRLGLGGYAVAQGHGEHPPNMPTQLEYSHVTEPVIGPQSPGGPSGLHIAEHVVPWSDPPGHPVME